MLARIAAFGVASPLFPDLVFARNLELTAFRKVARILAEMATSGRTFYPVRGHPLAG